MNKVQTLQEKGQSAIRRRGLWSTRIIAECVREEVIANLADSKLSVIQLANKISLNQDYLTRVFKHEMGSSIKSFIIKERMERARQLLETSNVSVLKVAEQTGYSSCSYFVAAFTKYFGRSPTSVKRGSMDQQI
jgi:two-component system response regulator YesN